MQLDSKTTVQRYPLEVIPWYSGVINGSISLLTSKALAFEIKDTLMLVIRTNLSMHEHNMDSLPGKLVNLPSHQGSM